MAIWQVQSDIQAPFHHPKALEFCKYVQKHYRIPNENILNVGDEIDILHGGMYPKDPNGSLTPNQEIKAVKEWVKEWASAFPLMKVCLSNHGLRWVRKATAAELPSQVLRSYKEIYDLPDGWQYADRWDIQAKYPFTMIHGMGYSGISAHRTAALDFGRSVVHGHLHSSAGISYIRTEGQQIYGFNVGCLIDKEAFAFSYGKYNRFKPCLGIGIIADDGRAPIWIPLE